MSSQEKPSTFSNSFEELKNNIGRKEAQEEEELAFGPIRPKKETEKDRAKLIELARKSLDL